MPIRPQAEIDEETRQQTFKAALDEKTREEEDFEPEVPTAVVAEEDEEIEVVEGEPEPEPEEDDSDKTSNVLGRLVDILENRPAPADPTPEVPKRAELPQVDIKEVKKKFNEQLHATDDPSALMDEYANAVFGGTLAQQAREIQELKKDRLKADPINGMVFERWGNEVETVIANLPAAQQNHPDAYTYAVNQVRNSHLGEIIDAQVEERVSAKTKPGRTATLGATATETKPKKRKTKKVYASATDKAEAKRYGLSLENYLKSRGKI